MEKVKQLPAVELSRECFHGFECSAVHNGWANPHSTSFMPLQMLTFAANYMSRKSIIDWVNRNGATLAQSLTNILVSIDEILL